MLKRVAVIRCKLGNAALIVALLAIMSGVGIFANETTALAQSPEDGESLFQEQCAVCHSTGTDTVIGPGLAGIPERAGDRTSLSSAAYIEQSLREPTAYVVDGFPAVMPTFADLSGSDISDLVAFLNTLSTEAAGPSVPQVAPSELTGGDAARGENFFTGPTRFENRGPSCSACHSAAGIGALGGGSLGPDLTKAFDKLGAALILWPETSRTMKPIFSERPLTDQEKADLLAFFESAGVKERSTEQAAQLFGLAVAGLAIIAALTHLIWRRRLRGVRKSIVPQSPIERGPSRPE